MSMPTVTLQPSGLIVLNMELSYPASGARAEGTVTVLGDARAQAGLTGLTVQVNSTVFGPFESTGTWEYDDEASETTLNLLLTRPSSQTVAIGSTVRARLTGTFPGIDLSSVPAWLLDAQVTSVQSTDAESLFEELLGVIGFRLINDEAGLRVDTPATSEPVFTAPVWDRSSLTREAHTIPASVTVTGGEVPVIAFTGEAGPTPTARSSNGNINLTWLRIGYTTVGNWKIWHAVNGAEMTVLATVDGSASSYQHVAPGAGLHRYALQPVLKLGTAGAYKAQDGQLGPEVTERVDAGARRLSVQASSTRLTFALPESAGATTVTATSVDGSASFAAAAGAQVAVGSGGDVNLPVRAGVAVTLTFSSAAIESITVTPPVATVSNLSATATGASALISWLGNASVRYAARLTSGGSVVGTIEAAPGQTVVFFTGLTLGTAYEVAVYPIANPSEGLSETFSTENTDSPLSEVEFFEASPDATITTNDTIVTSDGGGGSVTTNVQLTKVKVGGKLTASLQKTTSTQRWTLTNAETGAQTYGSAATVETVHSRHEYGYALFPDVETRNTTETIVTQTIPNQPDIINKTLTTTEKIWHPRGWVREIAVITEHIQSRGTQTLTVDRTREVTAWTRIGPRTWSTDYTLTATQVVPVLSTTGTVTQWRTIPRTEHRVSANAGPPEMVQNSPSGNPLELGSKGATGTPAWETPPPETVDGGGVEVPTTADSPQRKLSVQVQGTGKGADLSVNAEWSSDLSVIRKIAALAAQYRASPRQRRTVTYALPVVGARGGAVRGLTVTLNRETGQPGFLQKLEMEWVE